MLILHIDLLLWVKSKDTVSELSHQMLFILSCSNLSWQRKGIIITKIYILLFNEEGVVLAGFINLFSSFLFSLLFIVETHSSAKAVVYYLMAELCDCTRWDTLELLPKLCLSDLDVETYFFPFHFYHYYSNSCQTYSICLRVQMCGFVWSMSLNPPDFHSRKAFHVLSCCHHV